MRTNMKVDVDRIEGKMIVLIDRKSGKKFDMPVSLLPESMKEGDILDFSIRIDEYETMAARARVASKIERLISKNKE